MCLPITLINFSSAGNLQSKPYRIDRIKGNVGRIDRIKGDVGEKIKQKHKDCADKQKIKHIVERQPHHHWNHATRTRAQMHPHAQLKHVNKGRYLQRKDAQHTHASIVATLKARQATCDFLLLFDIACSFGHADPHLASVHTHTQQDHLEEAFTSITMATIEVKRLLNLLAENNTVGDSGYNCVNGDCTYYDDGGRATNGSSYNTGAIVGSIFGLIACLLWWLVLLAHTHAQQRAHMALIADEFIRSTH